LCDDAETPSPPPPASLPSVRRRVKLERPDRPKVEQQPHERPAKFLSLMYAPHEGHGDCRGRDECPCVFGEFSSPAPAAPGGLCDLCDEDMIATLHQSLPGRLTHLLNALAAPADGRAFEYVRTALGTEIEQEYRDRVARARHRKDPARPRRGSRPRRSQTEADMGSRRRDRSSPASCSGREGTPCVFGVNSQAAMAAPSGHCELCDPESMKRLCREQPAKLTCLLRALDQTALAMALNFLNVDVDAAAAENFAGRVARAHHRRDPARPKRKPRGAYKKSGAK